MMMPGREYQAQPSRFGFNGKENDNEVKGFGNQEDYGMRIYDTRIGKFLSIDPLSAGFPAYSAYQFAGNTPIQAIDLDGEEPKGFMRYWEARTSEYHTKWNFCVQDFYDYQTDQVWTVMHYPNTSEYYYWQKKFDGANQLFDPYNLQLNKNGIEWTGKFKEFKPKLLSQDKTFDCVIVGAIVGVPGVLLYGKAIAYYLASEVLEELAGVPIPDGPVDLWKYEMKRKASKGIGEEMAKSIHSKDLPFVPGTGPGGMRRLEYEAAEYHGARGNVIKSKGPANGQDALDVSLQIKETSPRRIGIDYSTSEFVVFDQTTEGVFHGHVRAWNELHIDMQNALIRAGMVDKSGKILK